MINFAPEEIKTHDDIINEEIEQEHAEKAMRDKIIDEVVEEMF